MSTLDLDTPHGPARAHLHSVTEPRAALVLGHGAGGGVEAPDLIAATAAAQAVGVTVALAEQPYRVAGRRSPAPQGQLDTAWTAVVAQLADGPLAGLPIVTGGRSMGARVACRCAEATQAVGVLCLAFPVRPPARKTAKAPAPDRVPELDAVPVPVLVVQGTSDPFGMAPPGPGREVVQVAGNHGLKGDLGAVGSAVGDWLAVLLARSASGSIPT